MIEDPEIVFTKLIEQEEIDIKTLVSDMRKGMAFEEMEEFCKLEGTKDVILDGKNYSSVHEVNEKIEAGDYNFKKERKQNLL